MPKRGRPPSRTIRQQFFIDASPKKVFRALSEPQKLLKWFLKDAEISLRKRGKYAFEWHDGYKHSGRVLEVIRGESITLSWEYEGEDHEVATTRVKFSVQPKKNGALVTLVNSGFPKHEKWVEAYAGSGAGWTFYLLNLKSVLERGHDLRSKHHG
jgi:uncharacterized protein YndB with AHSA1/START domain